MQAVTVVLVRHGHVADNGARDGIRLIGHTDVPLSSQGLREAQQLATCLEDAPAIAGFYTSPLRRARWTAEALARVIGRDAVADPALCEIDCGALDGMPIAEVKRRHASVWARNEAQDDRFFRWPGGESYAELRARVVNWLAGVTGRHAGGVVVAVTHAGFISQAIGALQGLSPARWSDNRPGNTSLTTLEWPREGAPRLIDFDIKACAAPPYRIGAPARDQHAGSGGTSRAAPGRNPLAPARRRSGPP
jgi:broad specificity phosphatase PhoE